LPVEFSSEFAKEEAEKRKREARLKEGKEFGNLLLEIAQQSFKEKLTCAREYWDETNESHLDEYHLSKLVPRTGGWRLLAFLFHRGRMRKQLVAQVVRNPKKAKFSLEIVVFRPEHEELAKNIAAIPLLVREDHISIRIVHKPIKF
jgi:hypothetical protein